MQVARESDFGVNDVVFTGRTHLGGYLQAGDMALGYDLARFVSADDNLDACVARGFQLPEFLLVKKDFSEARARRRARRRARPWKVKRLAMEAEDNNYHLRKNRAPEVAAQAEEERFLEVRLPRMCSSRVRRSRMRCTYFLFNPRCALCPAPDAAVAASRSGSHAPLQRKDLITQHQFALHLIRDSTCIRVSCMYQRFNLIRVSCTGRCRCRCSQ